MPQGNKRNDCPLQASALVQRSSDSCFLCPSIRSSQMPNTGHTSPGSHQSVRQPPYHPRTSWLLCIGHFCEASSNFILRILPCQCHKEAGWPGRNTSSFMVKSYLHFPFMALWPQVSYLTTLNLFCFVCLPKETQITFYVQDCKHQRRKNTCKISSAGTTI